MKTKGDNFPIKFVIIPILAILIIIGIFVLREVKNADSAAKGDAAQEEVLQQEEELQNGQTENQGDVVEEEPEIPFDAYETIQIEWNPQWEYAQNSILHDNSVTLYRSLHDGRPVIAVNAGHGTSGGNQVRTLCHPDGTAKVTGGSTAKGETHAAAVSSGTTMLDGTPEAVVNLRVAKLVKERLLQEGFSVLMIRESEDVQLDNIARTVFSNNNADCHIAIHYDSSDYDKGFFYIGVPDIASYKNMEPVKSHWEEHNAFGESLLAGMYAAGVKVYSNGNVPMDLTQTSYSTIPSMDVEVGDRGSDYSEETLMKIAEGIVQGVIIHFGSNRP